MWDINLIMITIWLFLDDPLSQAATHGIFSFWTGLDSQFYKCRLRVLGEIQITNDPALTRRHSQDFVTSHEVKVSVWSPFLGGGYAQPSPS